jgi:hypothetical protein
MNNQSIETRLTMKTVIVSGYRMTQPSVVLLSARIPQIIAFVKNLGAGDELPMNPITFPPP